MEESDKLGTSHQAKTVSKKSSNMYVPRKSTIDLEWTLELEKRLKTGVLKVGSDLT